MPRPHLPSMANSDTEQRLLQPRGAGLLTTQGLPDCRLGLFHQVKVCKELRSELRAVNIWGE